MPRGLHSVAPEPVSLPATLAGARVTLKLTLDHAGVPAEVRFVGLVGRLGGRVVNVSGRRPVSVSLEDLAAHGVDETEVRRALEALVQSAVTAASQWRYDAPYAAPIAFETTFTFRPDDASAPEAGWSDGALRVGGNVAPPQKIKDVRPAYPPEARAAGIQGIVIAEVRVAADGRVDRAHVVRSIPELDEAALEAIRQWEFTPTLMNGHAVAVLMTVTVQFTVN